MTVERQGRADDRVSPRPDRTEPGGTGYDIQAQLEPGEKLLWSGQPRRGLMLRPYDLFLIPFSLVWCGFAIFWEVGVNQAGAPLLFRLWGVPFVLIGLYIVFGRFFTDAMLRARTHYAVTDRRILIVSGFFSRNFRSIYLRGLAEMEINEGRRGRGTITFGPTSAQAAMLRGWPGTGKSLPPAFEGIEGARQVLEIIRKAQQPL
jgi:hypothetical protein